MKKTIPYNSIVWGLGAITISILLLSNPDSALNVAIMLVGMAAIIIGVVQLIAQLIYNKKNKTKTIPYVAIGSIVIGGLLLLHTEMWIGLVMVLLGVLLMLMAINMIIHYRGRAKQGTRVSGTYYIFPILLFGAGVLTVIMPSFLEASIVIFIGVSILIYGIVELMSYILLKKPKEEEFIEAEEVKDENNDGEPKTE